MKTKRIRAIEVRGWKIIDRRVDGPITHYVLPADAASYEQMVEQVARGIASVWATSDPDLEHSVWKREARAALAAIGIIAPKKGTP